MADQQNNSNRPWWAPDLQTTVALAIIVIVGVALFYRMTHPSQVEDKQLDTMLTIVFSTAFVALVNFLFGSSRSSQGKDEALSTLAMMPDTPVPPAPPAATVPVPPWWARLLDAEKNAITAAAEGLGGAAADPRVKAFVTASQVGAATSGDLDYLVSKGLLTAERAAAIQAA